MQYPKVVQKSPCAQQPPSPVGEQGTKLGARWASGKKQGLVAASTHTFTKNKNAKMHADLGDEAILKV
jgi:hypothetical protein